MASGNSMPKASVRLSNRALGDASSHPTPHTQKSPDPLSEIRAHERTYCGAMRSPARFAPLAAAGSAVVARRHRLCLVHRQAPSAVLVLVQLADRLAGAFDIGHFDEREPARLTRGPVANDVDRAHLAGALEERLEVGLGGFVRQVADV